MSASVNTKKSSVNSEFLKKTAEYLKGGALDYISQATPTISSLYNDSREIYSEVRSTISSQKETVLPVFRQIKSQMNFRGLSNWFLQKEEELDVDSGDSGLDKQEWDDGTESSNINDGIANQISEEEKNTNKLSKTMVETSHKMVEAQISATANVVTSINAQTASMERGFKSINDTLNSILEVVTKNTAAIVEVTTATAASQLSANDKMVEGGSFRLSDYKNLVKENFLSSPEGSFLSMIGGFISNPDTWKPDTLISMGLEGLLNKAAPNLRKNMEALDEAVSDTIMSSLIRIGDKANGSLGIGGMLGKIFGIDTTRENFNGGKSSLELKSVPFDTLTKESITSAIPGYLRKILVAVGGDDLVYDYKSRSFKSQGKIKKEFFNNVARTNNLGRTSESVQSKLGNEDYTKMMYDLMINDLSSKAGTNWTGAGEINNLIASLSNPKEAEKYLTGLLGKNATAADKKNIEILAKRLSRLDEYDLQNGIGLQAKKYATERNLRAKKYGETADAYGLDLSGIKDSAEEEAKYIMKMYGRKPNKTSSDTKIDPNTGAALIGVKSNSATGSLSGVDYTNRALYEIFRKLNQGINVFQTGSDRSRLTPYPDLSDLLPPPEQFRPKNVPKAVKPNKISSLSDDDSGGRSNKYDDENDLRNHELEDGTTEDLSKGKRFARWGKKRGRQFIGAMLGGSGSDVKDVLSASFRDIADVSGDVFKSGLSSINNSFGNVTGYLKHKMFGTGYSYQEATGEVDENGKPVYKTHTIKENEKAGLFGFFRDEIKMGWDKAKDNTKNWFKEVSGYFDDLKDGDGNKDVNTKRKKLIGASIGAFAGMGILGGPIGALVGGIAGNAIATSKWSSELHDKLFGRDEDTGDATGWFTKAFDKIMDPIEYQIHKTMDTISNGLKKHVFGPLSDLGYAIKERMLGHVKSIGKRMHEWFQQTWLGQRIEEWKERRREKREARREKRREFFGKVTDKLFGATAAAGGSYARGRATAAMLGAHGILGGSARLILGTDPEAQERLNERQRKRNEKMNLNKTESYDDWRKDKHKQRADRRRRFKNGRYTSEDEVSEEIASNTADMAETQSEIKSGIDQITGEIIPGSSFKTHDQGIHDRLDKLIELLGGKVGSSSGSTKSSTSSNQNQLPDNQGADLNGYNEETPDEDDENIIDAENYSIEDADDGDYWYDFGYNLGSKIGRGINKARRGLRWLGRKGLGLLRGTGRLAMKGARAIGRGARRFGSWASGKYNQFKENREDFFNEKKAQLGNLKNQAIDKYDELKGKADEYVDNKRAQFQGMKDQVMDDWNTAKGTIKDSWNKMKEEAPDKIKEYTDKAKDKARGIKDKANSFAQTALSSVVNMGMSGSSIDNEERNVMNEIIKQASSDDPNSSTISGSLQKMMNLQSGKKEEEAGKEEKKEGFLSKILGFLGGAGGILGSLGKIAAVIGAFYLLFKNDGFKTIAKNISGMMKTDAEMEAAGTDATTLGMNTATTLVDSQVENKWDWLNPFKSINHNSTDAAGEAITNSGMTKARNNVFLASGLKKMQTGTTFRQDYYRMKSDKALNKAVKWDEMSNALPEGVLADKAKGISDKRFAQAEALEAESNSFRSTNTGQLVNAAANIAGIDIMSRGAGGIAQGVASKLGASDEFAQKVGNTTQGVTAAGLTVNTISSAAKGKTSIVQKVIDAMTKILGKLFESIGASDKIAKMASKVGESSLVTGLKEAKDSVLSAVTTGVKNAGESLVAKLNEKLAEAGLGDVLTVTTGGLMIAAGAVAGAISGFCGTEHLFGVLNGQADAKMKLISTVIEAGMRAAEMVPGVGWVVACFDVIDGLVQSILGCGIKQFVARKLYELISLDGGAALAEKQEAFSAEKDYYNQQFGTNLSDAAFNDMTNNTGFFSRIWSGKAKLGEDGHYQYDEAGKLRKTGGIKNWFTGNDYKYAKDANGNIIQSADGTAVVAVDKYGNTMKDDKKLGDYLSFGMKNAGRTLFGGDVYATDEEGNVMYDEEGNPIVDHKERGFIGKMLHFQNPLINEQEKEMAEARKEKVKEKLSGWFNKLRGKKDDEEEAEAELADYNEEDDDENRSKLKDILSRVGELGIKYAKAGGLIGIGASMSFKALKNMKNKLLGGDDEAVEEMDEDDSDKEKADAEVAGYDEEGEEDTETNKKLKDIIAKGAKFGIKAAAGGGLLGLAARTAIKGLKNRLSDDIASVTSAISGYEENQFETDEEGNPIEYAVDKEGKPLNDDGNKFVKKGDLGNFIISGLLKVTETLTSPIDEMEKGIEEYNKKKSPWAKDGSKDSGSWLSGMVGKVWDGISGAFKKFSNTDVSAGGVGGPEEETHGGGGASRGSSTTTTSTNSTESMASNAATAIQAGANAVMDGVEGLTASEGGNPLNKDYRITSTFGPRSSPHSGNHKGVDLVPSDGSKEAEIGSRYRGTVTDVKSDVPDTDTAKKNSSGKWEYTGNNKTGNMVTIEADDGKVIKNMHIKAGTIPSNIKPGAKVEVGDKLGQMGSTGWSTGPHLHYQIEESGSPVDPTSYLTGTTMDSFKSNGDATISVPDQPTTSTTTSTDTTTSTSSSTSSVSTSSDEVTSGGSGPLGSILSALKSAGAKILGKITGGLLGETSDDSSSNSSVSTSSGTSSFYDTHGGGGAARGNTNVQYATAPNTQWLQVVRDVKKLVAEKAPAYQNPFTIKLNYNGKELSVRSDCTGIICAMLKYYGVMPEGGNLNSDGFLRDGAIASGFDKMAWPGWENLIEGDIMARSGHAEIFAYNEGNKHYVYNGGGTDSLRSAGPTRSSKPDYSVVWRCQEQAAQIADGAANGVLSEGGTVLKFPEQYGTMQTYEKEFRKDNDTHGWAAWGSGEDAFKSQGGLRRHAIANNRIAPMNAYGLQNVATIDGRMLIATTPNIGNQMPVEVGDHLDVKFTDGTVWNAMVGDTKGADANSPWGHQGGKCSTEIIYWDYDTNSGNQHKKVDSITKTGERYTSTPPAQISTATDNDLPTDSEGPAIGGDDLPVSTIGENRYQSSNTNSNPVRNNSTLPSTISSMATMSSTATRAAQSASTSSSDNSGEGAKTEEIIVALYKIIGLLETGNANTGQSNSLLSALGQVRDGGNSSAPRANIPKKSGSKYYSSKNSNNNRMITNMARPV